MNGTKNKTDEPKIDPLSEEWFKRNVKTPIVKKLEFIKIGDPKTDLKISWSIKYKPEPPGSLLSLPDMITHKDK